MAEDKKAKFKEVKAKIESGDAPGQDNAPAVDKPVIHRNRRTKAEIEAARRAANHPPLAQAANPLFIPIVKIPFDYWAANTVDSIKLTDDEASSLALPITQLIEYYLPQMNDIWAAWANLALQGLGIMQIRLVTLAEIRKAKAASAPATSPSVPVKPADKVPGEYKPKVI